MGLQTIKDLKAKLEAVKAEMNQAGKSAIAEAFKEIFEKYPQLEAVNWTQYTPYFNDGESCEFSVGEFTAKFKNLDEEAGDRESGFVESYGLTYYSDDFSQKYDYRQDKRNENHICKPVFDDLNQIQSMEDMLLMVFGDHQEITVYRDGTLEQNEYSHD